MKKYADEQILSWWKQLEDIPIDENEEIEKEFSIPNVMLFEKGTERNEIWLWFDENSSEGLAKLIGLK